MTATLCSSLGRVYSLTVPSWSWSTLKVEICIMPLPMTALADSAGTEGGNTLHALHELNYD